MKRLQALYDLYPWKRSYNMAKTGQGGIIGFSRNSSRLKIFDYSDVMFYDTVVLVVKRGSEFDFNTIHDLKGKRVGIQRGASYGDDFDNAKNHLFQLDLDDNSEQRLLKLLAERIDVAVLGTGKASVNYFIDKNRRLKKNRNKFAVLPKPLMNDPNYLGFEKTMQQQALINEVNKVLKEGYRSGDIQQIIHNYLKHQ